MNNKKLNVLYLEAYPSISSPLKTLANALERKNATSVFIDPYIITTKDLIIAYLSADIVVLQHYDAISPYLIKQLALATLLRVPIIRNWAGSDVLNSITEASIMDATCLADKIISQNMTTNHQGLVKELNGINLSCILLPQVLDELIPIRKTSTQYLKKGVLVYLPSNRRDFYGAQYIEKLIVKYPELTFYILADEEHYFSKYTNVKSLGWVNNTAKFWEDIGLLVRVTNHDGFPRMVIEALARGIYVIHNNDLPGVWFASQQNEIEHYMDKFIEKDACNKVGIDIYKTMIAIDPDKQLYNHLSKVSIPIKKWLYSLKYIIKFTLGF